MATQADLERAFDRLSRSEGARRSGPSSFLVRCPAHDDRTPSLSIKRTPDGRILFYCFAGCPAKAVFAALGLQPSRGQTVTGPEYVYTDADGVPLYRVKRFKGKRQRGDLATSRPISGNPQDPRFSDTFLIVTPGITIRDRLRVLLPNDPDNDYRQRDILPAQEMQRLSQAKILVTNFHAFQLRETVAAARLTKTILGAGVPTTFVETPDQMVRRVCRELGHKKNIVVLNDEAHHCYRRTFWECARLVRSFCANRSLDGHSAA